MSRPKVLDLFCGAGGVSEGLDRAGFDVVGVDLVRSPRYRFPFIKHDAMTLDPSFLALFDAIWASPPCQGYSDMRHAPGAKGAPLLIDPVHTMLERIGKPYVIENVEGAKAHMPGAVTLCGSMFGLGAQGAVLKRHRLFMSNAPISAPCACACRGVPVIGVYGGHARIRSAKHGGRGTKDVWQGGHRAAAAEAMGMPWATLKEMSEAVPPAYVEHLGRQLMEAIRC